MINFNKNCFIFSILIQIITIILTLLPRPWFDSLSALLYGVDYVAIILTGIIFLIGSIQDNEDAIKYGLIILIGAIIYLWVLNFWAKPHMLKNIGADAVLILEIAKEYIEYGYDFENYILPVLILISLIPASFQAYTTTLDFHIVLGIII